MTAAHIDADSTERRFGDASTVLVTGAGRGIGAAIARRIAADGASVIVHFNSSRDGADATVDAIESAGGRAVALQADLEDASAIGALFDAAERSLGPVDGLVNNAARRGENTRALDVDAAAFDRLFAANARAPALLMTEFARRVEARGGAGGRIVNLSSGQARTPMPRSALYAGAKGAVDALTRAYAADLGPLGVTVNAVAPGATATDTFVEAVPDDVKRATIASTALGRLGTPEDVADVVAFLLSARAGWVTGQVMDANGGLRRG